MIELGIDEAGRGPVLGPMVLAGVALSPENLQEILEWEKELGLKIQDSKLFGSSQKAKKNRELISQKIQNAFPHKICVLAAQTVDHYVESKSLNILEQEVASEIIQALPADQVILDGEGLFKPLISKHIKAFNKADELYTSVSAASIIAKATRDKLFEESCIPFKDSFGEPKGGGYANGKTLEFVIWHYKTYGQLPNFYRKSYQWKKLNDSLKNL